MAREGLRYELTGAVHKAVRQGSVVTLRSLRIGTGRGAGFVDITVQPIEEPEALRGTVMIVFRDVAPTPGTEAPGRARSAHGAQTPKLAQELARTREELETARQEMQSSQEELRSTNEELQSTNKELQSANEELTTSREEMESLNEELQTVNAELQSRVDDFVRANNDMQNLLNSTDIATVFLDKDFNLRRYTTQATKVIRLIPGDVGRPLTDIVSDLLYPALIEDAREVLRTLAVSQKEISTHDGSWFAVRIMPYRTEGGHTDGVVITVADITSAKKLEAELREREGFYRALFETLPVGTMVQDAEGSITYANAAAERILGLTLARMAEQPASDPRWKAVHADGSLLPEMEHPAMVALNTGRPVGDVVMGIFKPCSGERVWIRTTATPFYRQGEGRPSQVFSVFEEITGQKQG
jgi:two-component system CheB/CheR fusion protein